MLLETERLILRPLKAEDVEDILPYHSDLESIRYIPWDQRDREFVVDWLTRAVTYLGIKEGQPGLLLAIVEKSSNKVIGQLNSAMTDRPNLTADVGYISNPEYRGQGFVSEALVALIDFLFIEEKVHRIIADIDIRNQNSIRVVERLGFRKEATFVENDYLKGEWCSMHLYALLSREWPSK
jgi:RimJ/RimL family protein N-acetyltransferase